ncbi:hypothetical protein Bpfe_013650 [Biomphalaria pfeifferi]|uniref:Uncharacterized protein n=1 Tax=Biomphalaria pfeifferi TaxID=112525 RepID=A0AAD8BLV2_BIOPF|nr:hypothetical protein Bpfe_013650 [Biomphalaria pfeifferi]
MAFIQISKVVLVVFCIETSSSLLVPDSDHSTFASVSTRVENSNTLDGQMIAAFLHRLQLLNSTSELSVDLKDSRAITTLDTTSTNNNGSLEDAEVSKFIAKLNTLIASSSIPESKKTLSDVLTEVSASTMPVSKHFTSAKQTKDNSENLAELVAFQYKLRKLNNEYSQDTTSDEKATSRLPTPQETSSTEKPNVTLPKVTGKPGDTPIIAKLLSNFDDQLTIILSVSVAVVVLTILTISTCILYRHHRNKKFKRMMLNKELKRWDPQLLRPSQKNSDAFIWGIPIPTVADMVQQ